MIKPHEVHQLQRAAQARDPPGETARGMHLPAVERIAPQLAGRAEIIRRHAGDDGGPARLVEVKQLPVRPDVGAVLGDEDRDVADDLEALAPRELAQRLPLTVEQKLLHADVVDFGVPLLAGRRHARL